MAKHTGVGRHYQLYHKMEMGIPLLNCLQK
jgi:hypothetical protein